MAKLDVKKAPDMPTLPSLTEVIKPILIDQQNGQMPQFPPPNFGYGAQLPQSSGVPLQPSPNQQRKAPMMLPSLMNSLPQPPSKQSTDIDRKRFHLPQDLFLVNDRNHIEYDRPTLPQMPPITGLLSSFY
jgi:hypothetical protein